MEDKRQEEKLYIVMPAYNEEDNIKSVIGEWYPVLEGKSLSSRLVVADSGSTDSTHRILEDLKNDHPQLIVVSDTLKEHGPKLHALYKMAINEGADYIFQTDSDGQTSTNEFSMFWDKRKEYDIILADRTIREDGFLRKAVEKVVCILLRLYFKVKIPDANAPYRLMKADVVGKYIDRIPGDYFLPNIILSAFFSFYKEKLVFLPISFKKREAGGNSINIMKIVKVGLKSLKDFYHFKGEFRNEG